jgi:5-methylcytosine-specific restriction endonuclease McrA
MRPIREKSWLRLYRIESSTEQRGRCRYCGEPLTRETITGDHAKPRAKGGKTERQNIKAACRACNNTKGSMNEAAFLAQIKRQPQTGDSIHMWLAWSRRRIWMKTHRASDHIARLVGMVI